LKEGERVIPYIGPIKLEQPYDDAIAGRVIVPCDKIMHKCYNPEYDTYHWYLLPEDKAIQKRERMYDRVQ
jgi:hypothetical protein